MRCRKFDFNLKGAAFAASAFCVSLCAHGGFEQILNMVHHNPGEVRWVTEFNDARFLKRLGYTGEIPKLEPQCGLTYDAFDRHVVPSHTSERIWIGRQAAEFRKYVKLAADAGLPLYPQLDVLVVPKFVMDKYGAEMKNAEGRLSILRPRTQEILKAQLDEFFWRYPDVAGLTIRFGETYLHDTPYHRGGSPVRTVEEHATLVRLLREEVCVRRNRKVFYRTWDFDGICLHTNAKSYLAVTSQVEPHANLYFSIKHMQGDFSRATPFNPVIGIGDHRQIVEVSVDQGGLYGKNAYPYYFAKGAIDGFADMPAATRRGLRSLVGNERVRGLWLWTWGDGWFGPYFDNELWMRLNEGVLRGFAQHPERSEEEIFSDYVRNELHLGEKDARVFRDFCLKTELAVFRGQLTTIDDVPYQIWWSRDQHFLEFNMTNACAKGVLPAILKEKRDNLETWRALERQIATVSFPRAEDGEFARVSTTYARIKYELSELVWRIVAREAEAAVEARPLTPDEARGFVAAFEAKWDEWERLQEAHPCCPTLYETDLGRNATYGWPGNFGRTLERLRKLSIRQ